MTDKKVLLCPWCQCALSMDEEPWKFRYTCQNCKRKMRLEVL